VRDRRGNRYAAVAHWVRSYREKTCSSALSFDLPSPMPSTPQGRHRGGLSLGIATFSVVTSLDSGHPALRAGFAVRTRSCACVATQREVTRAAEAVQKHAAGEPDRNNATTRNRSSCDSFRSPLQGRLRMSRAARYVQPTPRRREIKTGAKGCRAQGALLQKEAQRANSVSYMK